MRQLWRAFKLVLPHRWMLLLYLTSSACLGICSGLPLLVAKSFINLLEHKPPTDKVGIFIDQHLASYWTTTADRVLGLCILAGSAFVLKAFFDFCNTYASSWLAQRLRMEAMESVMYKLLGLDAPFFDKQKTGDLVSRMVSDGDNLRRVVKIFMDFLQQPFTVVVLASIAFYYDPVLFCIGAIGAPLVFLPLKKVIQNIARQTKRYQQKTADLAQAMLQKLAGMRVIHAYDAAEKEGRDFADLANSLFRTGMRRNRNRALQRPLTEIMLGMGFVAVLYVAGIRSASTSFDPGAFVVFFGALAMCYGPVRSMMMNLGELAEILPSAERTFAILDVKPTIVDPPNPLPCPPLRKEIVFENVCFDYGRGPVLKDLNVKILAGEKIGVVGRTGVGKSTLLALLLRFYDPTSGRILIDGVDIRSVALASLRAQMALVTQHPFLFHATVADNILYGKPGAGEKEVVSAAQSAMVHDEIMAQPQGYQTLCGERGGELFSGGQRQRIAVARAILRNAPILLLDEATSALDAFSERRVQEALDKLVVSRTSLIVAHRLSTLRHVDRILVFGDDGRLEASGPHQELLDASPTYRRLWTEQQGGAGSEGAAAMS